MANLTNDIIAWFNEAGVTVRQVTAQPFHRREKERERVRIHQKRLKKSLDQLDELKKSFL